MTLGQAPVPFDRALAPSNAHRCSTFWRMFPFYLLDICWAQARRYRWLSVWDCLLQAVPRSRSAAAAIGLQQAT